VRGAAQAGMAELGMAESTGLGMMAAS
jgi:hypothetical protein